MAAEVVTRNWGARCDSIATIAPDKAGGRAIKEDGSAGLSTKKARSSSQSCLKPSPGAALKDPLL